MAYLPLSTANLPDPAIDPAQGSSPEDYFNTVLYSGNSSTQSITGVGHQPDFLWFKNRNGTQVHQLFDVVRGVASSLRTNGTDAENTDSPNDRLLSFDSDGFSLGADGNPNGSGNTYVAWAWKANGSGVSNTDGSITSTVSANTESGFSIVTYVGNNTRGATIGHGLNNVPEFVMVKNRDDGAENWACFHKDLAGTFPSIKLNTTDATVTSADGVVIRGSEFTSSVISVGENATCNGNGNDMVAYCFHSVEGFSKLGSYTGNGSTDGPFIYCGFRPAYFVYKRTDATGAWCANDSTRDTYNQVKHMLFPNTSEAENADHYHKVDFLSNGVKIRNDGNASNASGGTFIYMAFAENPFKYSNAR